jgi:hypothetical protein
LTLYCGRIYEIRGDDIPPSTYARTCRALLRRESRRRFNMVNLLDLSACPYLPRPPLLAPGSSYLRHASSTNRQPAQDVAFRFVPPPPPGEEPLATVCLHGDRQTVDSARQCSRIVKHGRIKCVYTRRNETRDLHFVIGVAKGNASVLDMQMRPAELQGRKNGGGKSSPRIRRAS